MLERFKRSNASEKPSRHITIGQYKENLQTLDPESFIRRMHNVKKDCDYGRNIVGSGIAVVAAPILSRPFLLDLLPQSETIKSNYAIGGMVIIGVGFLGIISGLYLKQSRDEAFKAIEEETKRRLTLIDS